MRASFVWLLRLMQSSERQLRSSWRLYLQLLRSRHVSGILHISSSVLQVRVCSFTVFV